MKTKPQWTEIINAENSVFQWNLNEIFNYRDLLFMFVKREFAATYKQTIFGPLWFFIQPLITTAIFVLVFGKIANVKVDIEPKFLFYLPGVILWNYFQECFLKTANVFKDNANLFGKVYFPRLIIPISIIISGLIKFSIQFCLFVVLFIYYLIDDKSTINPSLYVLLIPIYLLIMAGLALGTGLILTSITIKYKDLNFLLSFAIQLLMFVTPIIYSTNSINAKYAIYVKLNPLSGVIENFRNSFLGAYSINYPQLIYSICIMLLFLIVGIFLYNKVEKTFIDTI